MSYVCKWLSFQQLSRNSVCNVQLLPLTLDLAGEHTNGQMQQALVYTYMCIIPPGWPPQCITENSGPAMNQFLKPGQILAGVVWAGKFPSFSGILNVMSGHLHPPV